MPPQRPFYIFALGFITAIPAAWFLTGESGLATMIVMIVLTFVFAAAFEMIWRRRRKQVMAANEQSMRLWQQSIIDTAVRKLGRNLSERELRFLTAPRSGIALEMITDTVNAAEPDELVTYLNSEPYASGKRNWGGTC